MSEPILEFTGEYRFLSNFFLVPIAFEGLEYSSVEHAYQAAKTLDERERAKIETCSTPGQAKRAGRKVKLRPGWNDMRLAVMEQLLRLKFPHNSHLTHYLLKTYPRVLVEGNDWHDNAWGNCFCTRCEQIEGQNHLGRLLMKLREELLAR